MVNGRFLVVTNCVVNDTQIDVGEEFTADIRHFFVLCVVLDGVFIVLMVRFTHFHVVNTATVISEGFTMDITDSFTNLQEFLILINCLTVLSKIVVEDTS